MMRKSLMKRLTKSASDISGCKKKTHSTSPDEEPRLESFDADNQRSGRNLNNMRGAKRRKNFQDNQSEGEEEQEEDAEEELKSKSSLSVHTIPSHHNNNHHHKYGNDDKPSQGFLRLLKDRLTGKKAHLERGARSSSVRSEYSPGGPPDFHPVSRADQDVRWSSEPPEVVRFKGNYTRSHNEDNKLENNSTSTAEVIRHQVHVTPISSLPMALAQEIELALKAEQQTKVEESQEKVPDLDIKLVEAPNMQERPLPGTSEKPSSEPQNSFDRESSQGSFHSISNPQEDQQIAHFRTFSFFLVHVHLKQGYDLAARDTNGSSDPYVKFIHKSKVVYKSKTIHKDLNPHWDEHFVMGLEDPFIPIEIKVYDYDWAFRDDFMGEAILSLLRFELNKHHEVLLSLTDSKGKTDEYLGQLSLSVTLEGKNTADRSSSVVSLLSNLSQFRHRSDSMSNSSHSNVATSSGRKGKSNTWDAIVNVVLIEARDLMAMDFEGTSDPYCKFRLGNERYKSKPILATLNPKWFEQFDLSLFPDQNHEMEITIWDKDQRSKDDFLGRCSVDLSSLSRDTTHDLWIDIEDGSGAIHLLISISGLTEFQDLKDHIDFLTIQRKKDFGILRTFHNLNVVGYLEVKVYNALGLYAADLGGKSDPYAVLELDNLRVQTHTEYKTVSPTWNRVFQLPVRDINSVLYITVNDEDRHHTFEFLGRLAIPLLKSEPGKKKWYPLKDKKLRSRAKGSNPQILIETSLVWNPIRACITTLTPKEPRYMQLSEKFKRQIFLNNVMRIKAIIMEFVNMGKFVESCLEWEYPARSVIVFVAFLVITYYFQPYMAPIGLLLIFLKNYVILTSGSSELHGPAELPLDGLEEEEGEDNEDKEEKKTLKAKLQAIQEVTAMVQNAIGYVASLGEEVKNTFNFSVPFLSWLAIFILIIVALILYYISLRFLVLVWGINKFSKKLIRPNTITNNELLDFLSRVPDDEELLDFRELRHHVEETTSPGISGSQAKKKKQK